MYWFSDLNGQVCPFRYLVRLYENVFDVKFVKGYMQCYEDCEACNILDHVPLYKKQKQ